MDNHTATERLADFKVNWPRGLAELHRVLVFGGSAGDLRGFAEAAQGAEPEARARMKTSLLEHIRIVPRCQLDDLKVADDRRLRVTIKGEDRVMTPEALVAEQGLRESTLQ